MIIQHLASSPSVLPTDPSALEAAISALRSSIAALESSINTLDQSSTRWEVIGWGCSILVAVGVALEIVGLAWGYREELEEWARGIVRPPSHPSIRKLCFEIVATLLVVIGVFGEAGSSGELAFKNNLLRSKTSELRSKSDQLLALVTEVAGIANEKAANANERAAKADERAGKANERAKTLEVESLRLREQLVAQGPREALLRGDIRTNLIKALKPFAGQRIDVRRSASVIEVNGAVVMSTPIGDDTVGLSQALIAALEDAGWSSPQTPLLSSFQGQGLKVELPPKYSPATLAAAKALTDALRGVPLAVEGPLLDTDEQAKRVGTAAILPAFDDNTIILTVLTHP